MFGQLLSDNVSGIFQFFPFLSWRHNEMGISSMFVATNSPLFLQNGFFITFKGTQKFASCHYKGIVMKILSLITHLMSFQTHETALFIFETQRYS